LVAYVVPNKTTDTRPQTTDLKKEEGLGSWVLGLGSFSSELRQYLAEKLPEYMVPSAFVMMDELPLTPNGKVNRRALPAPEAVRSAVEAGFVAARTSVEATLAKIWADVLRLEQVGVYDNFFELGGDSILSIQMIARANQAGLRLSPQQVFQHQTIADLAAVAGTASVIWAEPGVVTGEVPLVPIQQWFFEQNLPEPHHWNQAILMEGWPTLDPTLLERAVQQLLVHHDALRLRVVEGESGWQQVMAGPDGTVPFLAIDLSELSEVNQRLLLETAAAQVQASLNLSQGPLLRVVLLELGSAQPSRLLIVIHHLAVDGVSWRILLEDLLTAYEQLSRGQTIELPPKTTSFKQWAERLREYAQMESVKAEMDYWLAEGRSRVSRLPVDYPEGRSANTEASSRTVTVSLSVEETRALLHEAPEVYRTQINDVLLTALVQAFSQWTGERRLVVDLEGHGREALFADVDLSRTVGWFTTIFPVWLDLERATDVEAALKTIKEQVRQIPNRGIGYGVLRYLSQDRELAEELRRLPPAEVSFNYLGQLDQVFPEASPFRPARESSDPVRSPQGSRRHLLDVVGSVARGCLHVAWTYSERAHRRETIERLAQGCMEALRSIIARCQLPDASGYTPSDFPLAQLDQDELEMAFGEVEFEGR
jgi:non-ribosomal peptide synthase protein (TIGR01720 family)